MCDISPIRLLSLKVIEFLNDLDHIIGDVTDFRVFKQSMKLLSIADERSIHQSFNKYICVPYAEYIMSENEVFFLHTDVETHENLDVASVNFSLIRILRDRWMTLHDHDREAIWKHLKVLVILNRRCLEWKKT
jgi:hypothetical protein